MGMATQEKKIKKIKNKKKLLFPPRVYILAFIVKHYMGNFLTQVNWNRSPFPPS
jgi:hypothetical protein